MRTLSLQNVLRLFSTFAILSFALGHASATTFKNPLLIPTSTDILGLATADINHDGNLDLIYVDGTASHAVHILLGKGDGTFSHRQDIGLPNGICCAVTMADVTGDGNVDIIMEGGQQFTSEVAVMAGNGDGTFQAPVVSTFQPNNIAGYPGFSGLVGVGDINGDGKVDLVLNDLGNGQLDLLLGDNSGKFTLSSTIQTYTTSGVYLVDLNGDNHLDIVATDVQGANFLVFLGNGDGTFQNYTRYTVGTATDALILADVDGDGHPDMLTQYYPGNLGVFKGNPDGTFGPLAMIGTVSDPLFGVSDFNNDAILDLMFTSPTGVEVALGKGGLTFSQIQKTVSGGTPPVYSFSPNPVPGDFNNDGHMDLATAVEGGISILLGRGDGTFASADFYEMGQVVGAAAVADFNGDKIPDIAVTLPATFPRLLIGNGSGGFTLGPDPNQSYGSQTADLTLLAADFNGDGKMDLNLGDIIPNTSSLGTQSVAIGLGDGTFKTPTAIPNSWPIIADFNGDGRSDMVYVGGDSIIVSLGQADGSFVPVTTALRLPFETGLFNVGDVNNDGKPDIVLNYYDHLEVWLGRGDGTFTYLDSINVSGFASVGVGAISDLDGDGNADIILSPNSDPGSSLGPLVFFYGNGDGTFQAPVFVPVSHRYSQITVADLNRDNKPDLVMTDGTGIAVMMNLGNRQFDSEVYYIAGRAVSALNVVDVNGDGFPDIVVANPGGTTVTVLLNQPNGTSPEGVQTIGSVAISPEPSNSGQPFNASLTISGETSGAPLPTGSVSFSVDGGFLASAPLANGMVSYIVGGISNPGVHTIIATYNGDNTYAPKSFAALHVVQPPVYATQTALVASPMTILASQTLRLVATVTCIPPVPSGVVTFLDGTNVLGAETVNSNGIAYRDTALLTAGTHTLTAKYEGFTQGAGPYPAAIFSPSASASVTIAVSSNATATALSSSAASPTAGTVVTFTANIASAAGTPFGGATFYDGNAVLGTSALKADGGASFSTASLGIGTHGITAFFSANGPFAGSTSSPLSVVVLAPPASDIPVSVSLIVQTDPTGQATLIASLNAASGSPRGMVTFLDNGTILGAAVADSAGSASLPVGALASGIHRLTASFEGTREFAPSVTPELNEQWPTTGPGFSLRPAALFTRVTSTGSQPLRMNIIPIANFQQEVLLSCANGLPVGYTCDFSPGSLLGGGTSTLVIQPRTGYVAPASRVNSFGAVFSVFSLLFLGCMRRRKSRFPLMLLICFVFAVLSGCQYSAPSSVPSQVVVLTISATSGNGAATIIHSAQVSVAIANPE